jgi:cytochrome c-type biogenesis protein CcmH/NrfG
MGAGARQVRGTRSIVSRAASDRAGRLDDAQHAIDEALRIAPGDPDALELLGNIRFSRGDHAGALDAWQRALIGKPEDAELRENVERLRVALASTPP